MQRSCAILRLETAWFTDTASSRALIPSSSLLPPLLLFPHHSFCSLLSRCLHSRLSTTASQTTHTPTYTKRIYFHGGLIGCDIIYGSRGVLWHVSSQWRDIFQWSISNLPHYRVWNTVKRDKIFLRLWHRGAGRKEYGVYLCLVAVCEQSPSVTNNAF